MIIEALGLIFLVFFVIVIIIILIPLAFVLFAYFKLSGNTLTFQKLVIASKDFFVKLIRQFQNGFQSAKKSSQQAKDAKGNRIEDAEFREVD